MAKRKRYKTGGQALGKAIGQGSGKPRKPGREEPDRGEVWSGKERLWNEPDKGEAQKHQPVVDRLHHIGAQPGQIGRGGTPVPGFFSMGDMETAAVFNYRLAAGEHKNKKPVQIQFWTGFKALEYLSFSADPIYGLYSGITYSIL